MRIASHKRMTDWENGPRDRETPGNQTRPAAFLRDLDQ
jgi:hypothetical protein